MKGAFWTSCAHHLRRVCATTCINFEDWDEEKKAFKYISTNWSRENMQIALTKHSWWFWTWIFTSWVQRSVAQTDVFLQRRKKRQFPLADSVVTLFQFEYLWNLLGMCWNFTHCKAKLINYERLTVFLQRRGQQARYRTVFITPICACHTYFKSLMHHHCREEVCFSC